MQNRYHYKIFLEAHFTTVEQLKSADFEPDDLIEKVKLIAAYLCAPGDSYQALRNTLYEVFLVLLNKAEEAKTIEKSHLLLAVARVLEFDTLSVEQRQSLKPKYFGFYKKLHGDIPSLKLLSLERLLEPNQDTLLIHTNIPSMLMKILKATFDQLPLRDTFVGARQLMRFNSMFKEYKEPEKSVNPVNDDELMCEPPAKRPKLN